MCLCEEVYLEKISKLSTFYKENDSDTVTLSHYFLKGSVYRNLKCLFLFLCNEAHRVAKKI